MEPSFSHGTPEQQKESAILGMWIFLITELLLFGGVILAYFVYQHMHEEAFHEGSHHLSVLLGGINTFVLLTSSLTMALAVQAANEKKKKSLISLLSTTIFLAGVFLCIKGVEYHDKFTHHLFPGVNFSFEGPHAEHVKLFFGLYFALTGLHALHVIIGMTVLSVMAVWAYRGRFEKAESTAVEVSGLYWHLVDVIWIFLFPLLYLLGRHP